MNPEKRVGEACRMNLPQGMQLAGNSRSCAAVDTAFPAELRISDTSWPGKAWKSDLSTFLAIGVEDINARPAKSLTPTRTREQQHFQEAPRHSSNRSFSQSSVCLRLTFEHVGLISLLWGHFQTAHNDHPCQPRKAGVGLANFPCLRSEFGGD
jgi:hypothetical protein